MSSPDNNSENNPKSNEYEAVETRRNLLKLGLGAGVILVVGGIGAVAKSLISPGAQPSGSSTASGATGNSTQTGSYPPPTTPGFPVILVANIADLEEDSAVNFNYPLEETPNILIKLGQASTGGVGPDSDIVAFSQICQHLGCIYGFIPPGSSPNCNGSYTASGPLGYCCCHGSVYDLVNGAKVIGGPAPRSVPQVILSFDSATGNIYATGMTSPCIFGHDTGSNDVSNDLQGGTLVG